MQLELESLINKKYSTYQNNQQCLANIVEVWKNMHIATITLAGNTVSFSNAKTFLIQEYSANSATIANWLSGFCQTLKQDQLPTQSSDIFADIMLLKHDSTSIDERAISYLGSHYHLQPRASDRHQARVFKNFALSTAKQQELIKIILKFANSSILTHLFRDNTEKAYELAQETAKYYTKNAIDSFIQQNSQNSKICDALVLGAAKINNNTLLDYLIKKHKAHLSEEFIPKLLSMIACSNNRDKTPEFIEKLILPNFGPLSSPTDYNYYQVTILQLITDSPSSLKKIMQLPEFSIYHFRYSWSNITDITYLQALARHIKYIDYSAEEESLTLSPNTAKVVLHTDLENLCLTRLATYLSYELDGAGDDIKLHYFEAYSNLFPSCDPRIESYSSHPLFKPFHSIPKTLTAFCLLESKHYQSIASEYASIIIEHCEIDQEYRQLVAKKITDNPTIFKEWIIYDDSAYSHHDHGYLKRIIPSIALLTSEILLTLLSRCEAEPILQFMTQYCHFMLPDKILPLLAKLPQATIERVLAILPHLYPNYCHIQSSQEINSGLINLGIGEVFDESRSIGTLPKLTIDALTTETGYSVAALPALNSSLNAISQNYTLSADYCFTVIELLDHEKNQYSSLILQHNIAIKLLLDVCFHTCRHNDEIKRILAKAVVNYGTNVPTTIDKKVFIQLTGAVNYTELLKTWELTHDEHSYLIPGFAISLFHTSFPKERRDKVIRLIQSKELSKQMRLTTLSILFSKHLMDNSYYDLALNIVENEKDCLTVFKNSKYGSSPETFTHCINRLKEKQIITDKNTTLILELMIISEMTYTQIHNLLTTSFADLYLVYQAYFAYDCRAPKLPQLNIDADIDLKAAFTATRCLPKDRAEINLKAVAKTLPFFMPWGDHAFTKEDLAILSQKVPSSHLQTIFSQLKHCYVIYTKPAKWGPDTGNDLDKGALGLWSYFKAKGKLPPKLTEVSYSSKQHYIKFIISNFSPTTAEISVLLTMFNPISTGNVLQQLVLKNLLTFDIAFEVLLSYPDYSYLRVINFTDTFFEQLYSSYDQSPKAIAAHSEYVSALRDIDCYASAITVLNSINKTNHAEMILHLHNIPRSDFRKLIASYVEKSTYDKWFELLELTSLDTEIYLQLICYAPDAWLIDLLKNPTISHRLQLRLYHYLLINRPSVHSEISIQFRHLINPKELANSFRKTYEQDEWTSVFTSASISFPYLVFMSDITADDEQFLKASIELLNLYSTHEQKSLNVEWALQFDEAELSKLTHAIIILLNYNQFDIAVRFIETFTQLKSTTHTAEIFNALFSTYTPEDVPDQVNSFIKRIAPRTASQYQAVLSDANAGASQYITENTPKHLAINTEALVKRRPDQSIYNACINILASHQLHMPFISLDEIASSFNEDQRPHVNAILQHLVSNGYLTEVTLKDEVSEYTGLRISNKLAQPLVKSALTSEVTLHMDYIDAVLEAVFKFEINSNPMKILSLFEELSSGGASDINEEQFKYLISNVDQLRINQDRVILDPSIEVTANHSKDFSAIVSVEKSLTNQCKAAIVSWYHSYSDQIKATLQASGAIQLILPAEVFKGFYATTLAPILNAQNDAAALKLIHKLAPLFRQALISLPTSGEYDVDTMYFIQHAGIPSVQECSLSSHDLSEQMTNAIYNLKLQELQTHLAITYHHHTLPILWCTPAAEKINTHSYILFLQTDPETRESYLERVSNCKNQQSFSLPELQLHAQLFSNILLFSPDCKLMSSPNPVMNISIPQNHSAKGSKTAKKISWWETIATQSESRTKQLFSSLLYDNSMKDLVSIISHQKAESQFEDIQSYLPHHITPRPPQISAFRKICRSPLLGQVVNLPVGEGKTLLCVSLISRLIANSTSKQKIVVLCPVPVIGTWAQEITKFCPFTVGEPQSVSSVANTIKLHITHGPSKHTVIIGTHPYLQKINEEQSSVSALIIDEAHAFCKAPKNKTNLENAVSTLKLKQLLLNTATPLLTQVENIFSLCIPLLRPYPQVISSIQSCNKKEKSLENAFRGLARQFTHEAEIISATKLLKVLKQSTETIGLTSLVIQACLTTPKALEPLLLQGEYKREIPTKEGHCKLCETPHQTRVSTETIPVAIPDTHEDLYRRLRSEFERTSEAAGGSPDSGDEERTKKSSTLFSLISRARQLDTSPDILTKEEKSIAPYIKGLSNEDFAAFVARSPRVNTIGQVLIDNAYPNGMLRQTAIFTQTYIEMNTLSGSLKRMFPAVEIVQLTGNNNAEINTLNKNTFNNIVDIEELNNHIFYDHKKRRDHTGNGAAALGTIKTSLAHMVRFNILIQISENKYTLTNDLRYAFYDQCATPSYEDFCTKVINSLGNKYTPNIHFYAPITQYLFKMLSTRIIFCTPCAIEGISLSAEMLIDAGLASFKPDIQVRGRIGRVSQDPLHGQQHLLQPVENGIIRSRVLKLSELLSSRIYNIYENVATMVLQQSAITEYNSDSIEKVEQFFITRVGHTIAKAAVLYQTPVNSAYFQRFIDEFPQLINPRDNLKAKILDWTKDIKTNLPNSSLIELLYSIACYIDIPTTLLSFKLHSDNLSQPLPAPQKHDISSSDSESSDNECADAKRPRIKKAAVKRPSSKPVLQPEDKRVRAVASETLQRAASSALPNKARQPLYVSLRIFAQPTELLHETFAILDKYFKNYRQEGAYHRIIFLCPTEKEKQQAINMLETALAKAPDLLKFITERMHVNAKELHQYKHAKTTSELITMIHNANPTMYQLITASRKRQCSQSN